MCTCTILQTPTILELFNCNRRENSHAKYIYFGVKSAVSSNTLPKVHVGLTILSLEIHSGADTWNISGVPWQKLFPLKNIGRVRPPHPIYVYEKYFFLDGLVNPQKWS